MLLGILILVVSVTFIDPEQVSFPRIGGCAANYDEALREVTGSAEIAVDFRDGEVVAVRCTSADVGLN